MGRWARLVAALTVLLTIGACTRVVDGHGERSHPPIGAQVQWQPCEKGAECGELAVPIDYDHPEKGVATIALIRYRATGEKIGSL
ncbi:MAG: alpha/beta hydrolase, partial [Candidatus Sericytochromatia bacterium]